MEQVNGGIPAALRVVGFGDVITKWFGANAGEVTGVGSAARGRDREMPPFWEIGVAGLAIDPQPAWCASSNSPPSPTSASPLNPRAVEGQDLGAATQGLGGALSRSSSTTGRSWPIPNMVDYRVPRITDVPRRIHTVIAERGDGVGPYGAKGAGEGALNPVAAAVAARSGVPWAAGPPGCRSLQNGCGGWLTTWPTLTTTDFLEISRDHLRI